jgi:hypothetical protein
LHHYFSYLKADDSFDLISREDLSTTYGKSTVLPSETFRTQAICDRFAMDKYVWVYFTCTTVETWAGIKAGIFILAGVAYISSATVTDEAAKQRNRRNNRRK